MAQPANQFTPRQLMRAVPFSTPRSFVGSLPAANGTGFGFDVGLALSDRNTIGYTTPQVGFATVATGFILDVSVFASQASTLDVLFTTSFGGVARSVMTGGTPVVIAASTLTFVAGLRVIGLFCTVNFVNTAGVASDVELFAAVRSG